MPIFALGDDRPDLGPEGSTWIAPTAVVVGRVRLRRGAAVWFNAVLRGDNEWMEIGEDTNIQDLAMLHSDMGSPLSIGRGCTIGHSAIIHGCTIGDNTLIGMGATILNGARIGNNCLVGANALVTEGREFPDGSLIVGAPAKAIRALDEATIAGLGRSAANYVANWKRFAATMTEI